MPPIARSLLKMSTPTIASFFSLVRLTEELEAMFMCGVEYLLKESLAVLPYQNPYGGEPFEVRPDEHGFTVRGASRSPCTGKVVTLEFGLR